MANVLKPCPFCGEEAYLFDSSSILEPDCLPIQVRCNNVDCPIEFSWYETQTEAIKAWNTRADDNGGSCG